MQYTCMKNVLRVYLSGVDLFKASVDAFVGDFLTPSVFVKASDEEIVGEFSTRWSHVWPSDEELVTFVDESVGVPVVDEFVGDFSTPSAFVKASDEEIVGEFSTRWSLVWPSDDAFVDGFVDESVGEARVDEFAPALFFSIFIGSVIFRREEKIEIT